jgi:hypothetical protein
MAKGRVLSFAICREFCYGYKLPNALFVYTSRLTCGRLTGGVRPGMVRESGAYGWLIE